MRRLPGNLFEMTESDALLQANAAFYAAFAAADSEAMAALWSDRAPVSVIHPGMRPIVGHAAVLGSWRAILDGSESCDIACRDPEARVYGAAGLVLCHENVAGNELAASNVFVRQDGVWRMVHHQAAPAADRPRPGPASRAIH